jgi:hypothetical protein
MTARILVIDDNRVEPERAKQLLEWGAYAVFAVRDAADTSHKSDSAISAPAFTRMSRS